MGFKEKKYANAPITMDSFEDEVLREKEIEFDAVSEDLRFENMKPLEASKKLRSIIETKPRMTYKLENSESLNKLVDALCDRTLYFSRHNLITNGELILTISNIAEFVPKKIIEKSGTPLARLIADAFIKVSDEIGKQNKNLSGINAVLLDNIYFNNLYNIPEDILTAADIEVTIYKKNKESSLFKLVRNLPEQ